ncbi:MAG: tetratricopeptide repeat protein [Lentisphaeria bacterium]|nr:tetratricopeptide repeat protein [Lentisphaeria bacterium]
MISSKQISVEEIIAGCDRLFNSGKMDALGEHLRFWRNEAALCGDKAAELTVLSELMGHYRMMKDHDRGIEAVREGFALMRELNIGKVAAGTILINGATALQSFGIVNEALEYYQEALACYRQELAPSDRRFAGLFNNMAAAFAANGDIKKAENHYLEALDILKNCGQIMDQAVTLVNLAQLYAANDPADPMIKVSLECAMECFNDSGVPRDGYYAHTCSKCAAAFGELGYPEDEKILKTRAGDFYAGA